MYAIDRTNKSNIIETALRPLGALEIASIQFKRKIVLKVSSMVTYSINTCHKQSGKKGSQNG